MTTSDLFHRSAITFRSGFDTCAGIFYLPITPRPVGGYPAIVLAPGLGTLKEMGLLAFAERFAAEGLAALLFEYSGFTSVAPHCVGEVHPLSQSKDRDSQRGHACSA